MSIQTTEIDKLKEQVKGLEDTKKLVEVMYQEEAQKANRLTERIHKLEKELSLKEPLAQEKQPLCANIIKLVNDIWPSIHVIFEHKDLIKEVGNVIQKFKEELGKKPEEATEIIKFLNSKNKQELEELGINNIIENILEVKKMISKRNMMIHLEDKC